MCKLIIFSQIILKQSFLIIFKCSSLKIKFSILFTEFGLPETTLENTTSSVLLIFANKQDLVQALEPSQVYI
jgi:signal recognition particle receptor subunit beta